MTVPRLQSPASYLGVMINSGRTGAANPFAKLTHVIEVQVPAYRRHVPASASR